jgi:hypothetical protein
MAPWCVTCRGPFLFAASAPEFDCYLPMSFGRGSNGWMTLQWQVSGAGSMDSAQARLLPTKRTRRLMPIVDVEPGKADGPPSHLSNRLASASMKKGLVPGVSV